MALNLVKAAYLTRKNGQSTISHAAYIDRAKYIDERTGRYTKDYASEGGLEWKEVWLPKDAPEWMRDPEKLWNALEKREDQQNRRENALLSRSWIMAIPKELDTPEQRLWMVKDMLREFTRDGWVCQAAIHEPDNDNKNWHVHIQSPMRHITPDGFGLRREANADGRFESKLDELKHWKDRWSEIGAQHLRRAGFTLEAERFRSGHLNREDKLNDALDRGDKRLADKLEDKPHVHLGPAAFYMDQKGYRTRKGEENLEIDFLNHQRRCEREEARAGGRDASDELRGVSRHIWWAYNGTNTPEEFRQSLNERRFELARITPGEAAQSLAKSKQAAQPVYREGEYVVVTEAGYVYRLTPRTTGDQFYDIKAHLKSLDAEKMLSMEDTKAQFKEAEADRIFTRTDPSRLRETRQGIWMALYDRGNGTPQSFRKDLEARDIRLARVTQEDQEHSKTHQWYAERHGRYAPILREGEYVVVDRHNHVYQLNPRNTGLSERRMTDFTKPLDLDRSILSLRTTQMEVEEERIKGIDPKPRGWHGRSSRGKDTRLPGRINRSAERVAGKTLEFAAGAVESFFARSLTPQEKERGRIADLERQLAAEAAERQRQLDSSHGRDR